MKKLLKIVVGVVAGLAFSAGIARADSLTNGIDRVDSIFYQVFTESAAAFSKSVVIDLDLVRANRASFQVNYQTATVPAVTFTDGIKSTASLTVSSNTALSTATASTVIKLVSTQASVSTSWIAVYGVNYATLTFLASRDWTFTAFSTQNAVNAAAAINVSSRTLGVAATVSASSITLTAITPGEIGNGIRVAVSTVAWQLQDNTTGLTVNLSRGRNAAVFKIGNFTFTNGLQWNTSADGTSSTTAKNIATAIGQQPGLTGVIIATWAANGIVYATASTVFTPGPDMFSSTMAALTLKTSSVTNADGSGIGYFFGTASLTISTQTSRITKANSFTNGLPVLLTITAGTAPTPLVNGTTYFVTNVSTPNTSGPTPISPLGGSFQLSFTSTGAVAGLAIPITALTGAGTFVLTPSAFTGSAGYIFEVSNDSATWVQQGSSVAITAASVSSTTWHDFGTLNWHYVRQRFVAPTFGGVGLNSFFNGRN